VFGCGNVPGHALRGDDVGARVKNRKLHNATPPLLAVGIDPECLPFHRPARFHYDLINRLTLLCQFGRINVEIGLAENIGYR
jgi:hypothetical protein